MTETNDKIRGLFLSAMLVMSVFAGTVAIAGSAAAQQAGNVEQDDDDADLEDGERYWQGQSLFYNNETIADEDKIELVEDLGEDGEDFVRELTPDDDGDVRVGTSNLEGSYALQHTNGTNLVAFDVGDQNLGATFDPTTVDNEYETNSTLGLESDRTGYNAVITASGLNSDQLEEVLDTNVDGQSISAQTDDGVAFDGIQTDSLTANFEGVDAGNYTFTVEVNDTGATAESNITVEQAGDSSASFAGDSVVTQERGDVAAFTVDLDNTGSAEVAVGGASVNWKANFTVEDGDDDDNSVTVLLDTYNTNSEEISNFVNVADPGSDGISTGDDQGVFVSDGDGGLEEGSLDNPIAAGSYEMTASIGGTSSDVAQLSLREPSVDGAQTWTYPETTAAPSDVESLVDGITEDDSIAKEDLAVVEISASGLYGNLTDAEQLDYAEDGSDAGDYYNFSAVRTNAGANANPDTLGYGDNSEYQGAYIDAQNDTVYVAIDTASDEFVDNGEYEATFSVDESSPVFEETQSVNTTFSVADREIEFTGLNENDVLNISASSTEITGETNLAAESEFNIQVQSDSFVRSTTATVADDGTFSADFNFSDVEPGTEVTVSVVASTAGGTNAEVDGQIVEGQAEDPGTTTTTTEDTTTTTEDTTTTTTETTTTTTETTTTETTTDDPTTEEVDGETTTDPGNGGNIPGFGMAVSLVALVAAALLALRRSN